MARYVVAVSGGVDSVVLLDMLRQVPGHELTVAHFDHGIRSDSADDALFVETLARTYGLPYVMSRKELGAGASEELARHHRYEFLRGVANELQAQIVTAHHADDVAETVAINLLRGTGWRGLAVLDSDILRPLAHLTKQELIDYAIRKGLEWREDSTNADQKYLRNKVRARLKGTLDHDARRQLVALRETQRALKKQIRAESLQLIGDGPTYSRYFFTHIPKQVALELLRHVTRGGLTRPQLERLLVAIKTAQAGSLLHAGSGILISFTSRNFSV